MSDDDADDDRPLKDWGAKARPEPTDDAAIEAKNAARFVGKTSMVINSPMDLCTDPLSLFVSTLLIRTTSSVSGDLNRATVMLVFVVHSSR